MEIRKTYLSSVAKPINEFRLLALYVVEVGIDCSLSYLNQSDLDVFDSAIVLREVESGESGVDDVELLRVGSAGVPDRELKATLLGEKFGYERSPDSQVV